MKTIIALISVMLISTAAEARYSYGGGRHTANHGGYYAGGSGSSHKGGHYRGPHGGYGRHK